MFCLYGIIRMIVPQGHVYLVAAAAVDTKSLFIVFVKRGVPRTSLNGLLVFFSWRHPEHGYHMEVVWYDMRRGRNAILQQTWVKLTTTTTT